MICLQLEEQSSISSVHRAACSQKPVPVVSPSGGTQAVKLIQFFCRRAIPKKKNRLRYVLSHTTNGSKGQRLLCLLDWEMRHENTFFLFFPFFFFSIFWSTIYLACAQPSPISFASGDHLSFLLPHGSDRFRHC